MLIWEVQGHTGTRQEWRADAADFELLIIHRGYYGSTLTFTTLYVPGPNEVKWKIAFPDTEGALAWPEMRRVAEEEFARILDQIELEIVLARKEPYRC